MKLFPLSLFSALTLLFYRNEKIGGRSVSCCCCCCYYYYCFEPARIRKAGLSFHPNPRCSPVHLPFAKFVYSFRQPSPLSSVDPTHHTQGKPASNDDPFSFITAFFSTIRRNTICLIDHAATVKHPNGHSAHSFPLSVSLGSIHKICVCVCVCVHGCFV